MEAMARRLCDGFFCLKIGDAMKWETRRVVRLVVYAMKSLEEITQTTPYLERNNDAVAEDIKR